MIRIASALALAGMLLELPVLLEATGRRTAVVFSFAGMSFAGMSFVGMRAAGKEILCYLFSLRDVSEEGA
jgi:hypothetical protein